MPPKDAELIARGLKLARGLADGTIVSVALSLIFDRLIERKDYDKISAKMTSRSFTKKEVAIMEENGYTKQQIKDEIDLQKQRIIDSENIDKIKVLELEQKAREAEQRSIKQAADNALALQNTIQEQKELRRTKLQKQATEAEARKQIAVDEALARGVTQGTSEQLSRLEQGQNRLEQGQSVIQNSINAQLKLLNRGEYKDRKIQQIDFKRQSFDDIKGGIGGLGLTEDQRDKIKAIIKKETKNEQYAESFDLIAGNDMDINNLFSGLVGIGLSMALPIPANIISSISNQLLNTFNIKLEDYFDKIDGGDGNEILLINEKKAEAGLQYIDETTVSAPVPAGLSYRYGASAMDDQKLNTAYEAASTTDIRGIDREIEKKKLLNSAKTGAMIGAAAGYLSSPINAVIGGSAGAIIGASAEIISRSNLPQIAQAVTQRIVDATPQIPTITGMRRGVQRQITTGETQINIPRPSVSIRGTNNQERATLYNDIDELNRIYNEMIMRQRILNSEMVANAELGRPNRLLIDEAKQIINSIQENRNMYINYQNQIDGQPRARLDIQDNVRTVPTLRRTTDDEKKDMQVSLPYDEKQERYSKEKSLAVLGAAGALTSAIAAKKIIDVSVPFWKEKAVTVPEEILTMQQGEIEKITGKGLLRPKFIIPAVDILQPSNQELSADALEFSAFDYVRPGTEGGEGDIKSNILKRIQEENNNIRFRGAGVQVNSLFGYDLPVQPSQETINSLFLYKALPPLKFQEQQYNLSEFEVMSYDPNNIRNAIEMFSPYDGFSDNIPDDRQDMDESILFSIVP